MRTMSSVDWVAEKRECISDTNVVSNYLVDESRIIMGKAEKVCYPLDERDISNILDKANKNGWLVTVSGGGTGLTGARVPIGGIVLSTEYLTTLPKLTGYEYLESRSGGKRIEIAYRYSSDENFIYVFSPVGISIKLFIDMISRLGLIYPPNPTEKMAFIGGNLSTHASGKWSFRFGPLRKYVNRLRIVLPNGDVIDVKRGEYKVEKYLDIETLDGGHVSIEIPLYSTPNVKKSSAWPNIKQGMDLVDFFVGMEGILGVYSMVEYRLPRGEETYYSIFSIYDEDDNLLDGVEELRSKSMDLGIWALEYMDNNCIDFIRSKLKRSFPHLRGGGILYIDVAGGDDIYDKLSEISGLLDSTGAIDSYGSDDPRWINEAMNIRHLVPESVNEFIYKHGTHRVASDASAPDKYLREIFSYYRELGEEYGVKYLLYGHIGDTHLHFNFLSRNKYELEISMRYLTEMLRHIVGLGGSVTAEHGFGKKRFLDSDGEYKPLIILQYGYEGLEAVRDSKMSIDKNYILNVGNIVPAPG